MLLIFLDSIQPLLSRRLVQMRIGEWKKARRCVNTIGGSFGSNAPEGLDKEGIGWLTIEVTLVEVLQSTVFDNALRRLDDGDCLDRQWKLDHIVRSSLDTFDRISYGPVKM